MQKKIIPFCSFLFTLCISVDLNAQTVENTINLHGLNYPQEKIHIHFDKESYLPGETIWFKAYLFEENLPSERSTNFYAALYDNKGNLIEKQISPVFNSVSLGHFVIPDSLETDQVICRGYTNWMMNFDTSLFYSRSFKLINDLAKIEKSGTEKTVGLRFFPEGGNIIEGTVNSIAFKANYNNGLPFFTEGAIKKQETGEIIKPLTVSHDGMGKFDLDFIPGEKYVAEWIDNNGVKQRSDLPAAKSSGVSLKLTIVNNNLFYNLHNKTGADSLHVVMYMYQKVFYKTSLSVSSAVPFTGVVPVRSLPAGTMQITVFDVNWQPVAERVAFINNNNFSFDAGLYNKEINLQKRGKNVLEIFVSDTIPANMSVSITDAEMNNISIDNTIISDFLLKGDLKGYIHNPAYYFTGSADEDKKLKLDLVMLTNGWRRYNWPDLMVQKMPEINYPVDDYLGVYGQVGTDAMKKMEKDELVSLIIKTWDSTNMFFAVKPESSGIMRKKGLIFYDSARVFFSFNKSKLLNKQMAFSRSNFLLNQSSLIENFKDVLLADTAGTGYHQNLSLFKYYKNNNGIKLFNDEITMEAVIVKSGGWRNWKNDPVVKLNDRYATGMFAGGGGGFAIDVLHDEKAWTKLDIYTYIRGTIPGLNIGSINVLTGRSFEYLARPVTVFIDERQVIDNNQLEMVSLYDVAYIKLIPNYVGINSDAGGSVMGPALAVYLKKGDDLIDRRPKETDLGNVTVAGYSPFKEFYSPDYSQTNTTGGTDARSTLLWLPYILTDKNNRNVTVTFYNNDFTKKIRVVLEGINDEGKMIHIEKVIE